MMVLIKSSIYTAYANSISLGITIDLLIFPPLLYFLVIIKTKIPKISVIPFLVFSMVLCYSILPTQDHRYLDFFKNWLFPVIEVGVVTFIIVSVRKVIKKYKGKKNSINVDFFTTLKETCYEMLPRKLVMPFVTEIAVFYYGFVYWKKRTLQENDYSYHKDSGTLTLLVAFVFIIGIETFVFHIKLSEWNNIVAWILTSLSVYSAIQIFGFLKSMLKRPISFNQGKLYLKYGIMSECTIQLEDIESIELSTKEIQSDEETQRLSIFGELEGHNIILILKKEYELIRLYGIKRKFKVLALYVDDKNGFLNRVKEFKNNAQE
ncbi:hypothetical protein NBT05_09355 [Aquimarina sp. ERC-38]|uniref:hypothetical protein n=1 Tax=Aquimarina sp. ERC-38 TaxID=2949996 RepID=UPI0022454D16|nr:hypothetical protein [Aquimarina sp. ERC-38]UZO79176.1 hypothetical protein NBT05_09355 [Aquimarina sp. ERC-38]